MYELSQLAVCLLFVFCTIKDVHIYIYIYQRYSMDAEATGIMQSAKMAAHH